MRAIVEAASNEIKTQREHPFAVLSEGDNWRDATRGDKIAHNIAHNFVAHLVEVSYSKYIIQASSVFSWAELGNAAS